MLLDQAIGVGGYPRGRIVEIFGPESSGKTTLALHAVAEAQKKGGRAAYIDAEHAIDPEYAAHLGVDINELILSQPDSGEQALEIVDLLAQSGSIDIIIVDSVAALVPQQELLAWSASRHHFIYEEEHVAAVECRYRQYEIGRASCRERV